MVEVKTTDAYRIDLETVAGYRRGLIASGQMKPGYACDNDAGIYFEDNEVKRVVATRADAKVYYVSLVSGKIVEKLMEPERIS